MSSTRSARSTLLVLLVATILVGPVQWQVAGHHGAPEAGPRLIPMGNLDAGNLPLAFTEPTASDLDDLAAWRQWANDMGRHTTPTGAAPTAARSGAPTAAPADEEEEEGEDLPEDTFGFTMLGNELPKDTADVLEPLEITIDMGDFARKAHLADDLGGYWLEMSWAAVAVMYVDGDGIYDPPGNKDGDKADDACPTGEFPLFTIEVNGDEIGQQMAEFTGGCVPGGPEDEFVIELKPQNDDDPLGRYRIPTDLLLDGENTITVIAEDFPTAKFGDEDIVNEDNNGVYMAVGHASVELVAPPLVISHGWEIQPNEGVAVAGWQPILRDNIRAAAAEYLYKDPWDWANSTDVEPFLLNAYDGKQDFRKSASLLADRVETLRDDTGYEDKIWLHGHSMGGLVSRFYVEQLGGSNSVEKLGQDGTPNLGSGWANAHTRLLWPQYVGLDGDPTADTCVDLPSVGTPAVAGTNPAAHLNFCGWREWWDDSIGAYRSSLGGGVPQPAAAGATPYGVGRDLLADFMIKPQADNPILAGMNAGGLAFGVDYFVVAGKRSDAESAIGGDVAVSTHSASMGGKIDMRIVRGVHHGDLPSEPETAEHLLWFYAGLDLDDGHADLLYPPPTSAPTTQAAATVATPGLEPFAELILHPLPADVDAGVISRTVDIPAPTNLRVLVQEPVHHRNHTVTLVAPSGLTHPLVAVEDVTRTHHTVVPGAAAGTWTINIQVDALDRIEPQGFYATISAENARFDITTPDRPSAPGTALPVTVVATIDDAPLPGAVVTVAERTRDGWTVMPALHDGAGTYTLSIPDDGGLGHRAFSVNLTAPVAGESVQWSRPLGASWARHVDTAVTRVDVHDDEVWAGDDLAISAIVHRDDATAAQPIQVTFLGESSPAIDPVVIGTVNTTLMPGAHATTLTIDTLAPPHGLLVRAVVATDVLDPDPANNERTATSAHVQTPRTLAHVSPTAAGSVWGEPVAVTLAAADGLSRPYQATSYRITRDGASGSWSAYDAPILLDVDGTYMLEWQSTSHAGDVEPRRDIALIIDQVAPAAALLHPQPAALNLGEQAIPQDQFDATLVAGTVDVRWQGTDQGGSGIRQMTVWVDEAPRATLTPDMGGYFSWRWDTTAEIAGERVLGWRIVDGAGHETDGQATVHVVAGRSLQIDDDIAATVERLWPGPGGPA